MPKGYLIGHVSISDATAYAAYAKAAGDAMRPFNPKVIAGGQYENLEGEPFDSFSDAKSFYESPEYQAAKALRLGVATGTFVIVEGVS